MGKIVENIREKFKTRRVRALNANLDFHGALQKYLEAKSVSEKELDKSKKEEKILLEKKAFEKLREICFALDPTDVRIRLAYIQMPKNNLLSDLLKEAASGSDLTYEEWYWVANQTFFTDSPKK